ncbi:kynurenine formamidase isoform X1 [Vespa velutina]|uniref:kynurenine formamidase isoform X1 n=1 Tax=Vespa velutina TaxID=202808 RepID=UPI001FB31D3C|nr:kynurenine formamidase isoform X1 [Vespa velutina]
MSTQEVLYSPSEWSKRFKPEELISRFLIFAVNVTKKARNTTKCLLDIPYGPTERTKYDIYGTDLPNDAPIFIYIHGGYWQELSKDFGGFSVPVLVANKIKVVSIGYDLCPNVKLQDIISQIKIAIETILSSAVNSGCRCVWICGHSAGAHLAAAFLHDTKWIECMTKRGYFQLIKGLLLAGGIYNLGPLTNTSYNEALKLTEDDIKELSFSTLDTKEYKPIKNLKVIVTVGECDSPVFINETREYAQVSLTIHKIYKIPICEIIKFKIIFFFLFFFFFSFFQKIMSFVDNVEYILLRDNIDHFDIVENLLDTEFVLTRLILQYMNV